ncbi:MAG: hypothetical protein ACR2QC_07180 [Gammaproteobacteria bacterium]
MKHGKIFLLTIAAVLLTGCNHHDKIVRKLYDKNCSEMEDELGSSDKSAHFICTGDPEPAGTTCSPPFETRKAWFRELDGWYWWEWDTHFLGVPLGKLGKSPGEGFEKIDAVIIACPRDVWEAFQAS